MKSRIYSLNIGTKKGEPKVPVREAVFKENSGVEGDVHAGLLEKRQVSILAWERIKEKNAALQNTGVILKPGNFAENVTTCGLNFTGIKVGARLKSGDVILEVSQIGKECHSGCAIQREVGSCLMPREGIFARVIKSGKMRVGDEIEIIKDD